MQNFPVPEDLARNFVHPGICPVFPIDKVRIFLIYRRKLSAEFPKKAKKVHSLLNQSVVNEHLLGGPCKEHFSRFFTECLNSIFPPGDHKSDYKELLRLFSLLDPPTDVGGMRKHFVQFAKVFAAWRTSMMRAYSFFNSSVY